MTETYFGVLSVAPALLAIGVALLTRQVYLSLLLGLWVGQLILAGGDLITGSLNLINSLVDVFSSAGNTRTVMFSALMGALLLLTQRAGGVEGFLRRLERSLEGVSAERGARRVQLFAVLTGVVIFIETTISVLTVGTLYRPAFDRLKLSRERLAYLADSTSAPASVLIPLNAWGAYILGLLSAQDGLEEPFMVMVGAIPLNLYALTALGLALWVAMGGRTFGPLAEADERAARGEVLREGAQPVVAEEVSSVLPFEGVTPRARNLLIPLGVMVALMPVVLLYTGWPNTEMLAQAGATDSLWATLGLAVREGSGSMAVLTAVSASLVVSAVMYRAQGVMSAQRIVDTSLKGIGGLMPLALMMVLAFALSTLCKQLGTGAYVAQLCEATLPVALYAPVVFVVGAAIAFSTGTSWGTFAIMIPIAVPLALSSGLNPSLLIAAALGGGVFGDHASPISDTTLVSSMAAATDHLDHVRTQLPMALIGAGVSVVGYVLLSLF